MKRAPLLFTTNHGLWAFHEFNVGKRLRKKIVIFVEQNTTLAIRTDLAVSRPLVGGLPAGVIDTAIWMQLREES